MIHLKRISIALSALLLLITLTQCVSAQNKDKSKLIQDMDKEAPISTDKTYYLMRYGGGVKSKGFTVYIPVDEKPEIELVYIYFKGKKVPLIYDAKNTIYRAKYIYPAKPDVVMSDDSKEEFKNQLPPIEETIPFELKHNEGVVGYLKNGIERHFKIMSIPNKTR